MALDPKDFAKSPVSVDEMLDSPWWWVSYSDRSDDDRFLGLVIAPGSSPQGATKFIRAAGLMPTPKKKGKLAATVYALGTPPVVKTSNGFLLEVPLSLCLTLLGVDEIPPVWLS